MRYGIHPYDPFHLRAQEAADSYYEQIANLIDRPTVTVPTNGRRVLEPADGDRVAITNN